jgi:hypothetical protein
MRGKFCHRGTETQRKTRKEKRKDKREKSNTEFTEKNWRAQRKPD